MLVSSSIARPSLVVACTALALLGACGANQDVGGPTFCRSYEDNYLTGCQAHCEADYAETDRSAPMLCHDKCQEDLGNDSTYNDSCPPS